MCLLIWTVFSGERCGPWASCFTITLLWHFSVSCEIMLTDQLDDIIQSTAPYVTIKFKENSQQRFYTNKVKACVYYFTYITCLLGPLYQNISPSVTRKPWHSMSPSAFIKLNDEMRQPYEFTINMNNSVA